MESKYGYKKITFFFLFCLLLMSCAGEQKKSVDPLLLDGIRNGDIICRLGNGFFSNQFKNYSLTEKIYSHVGIIEQDGDSLFVIHSEASELTGIGYVKREPVHVFLDDIKTWGVYRINADDSIHSKMATIAKEYFTKRTPFDMDFDASDDSKVYCTELVALAINKALQDSIVKPQMHIGSRKIYGIDNVYLLPNVKIIRKVRN